jgi:hypothetical protein
MDFTLNCEETSDARDVKRKVTNEDLKILIEQVRSGSSMRKVAIQSGIPYSTLKRKIYNYFQNGSPAVSPKIKEVHKESDGIGFSELIPVPVSLPDPGTLPKKMSKKIRVRNEKLSKMESRNESLKKAMDLVINQGSSVRGAAMQCDLPYATLFKKVQDNSYDFQKKGPPKRFEDSIETDLATKILGLVRRNMNPTKNTFLDYANELFKCHATEEMIEKFYPLQRKWVTMFFERHQFLELKKVDWIDRDKVNVTWLEMRSWFQ